MRTCENSEAFERTLFYVLTKKKSHLFSQAFYDLGTPELPAAENMNKSVARPQALPTPTWQLREKSTDFRCDKIVVFAKFKNSYVFKCCAQKIKNEQAVYNICFMESDVMIVLPHPKKYE